MFDWIGDALSWVGDKFSDVGTAISEAVWDVMLEWLFNTIYGAVAEFFGMMNGMGADIVSQSWVSAFLQLFSLFGWTLFAAGLVVAVFDTAIEYETGRANIQSTCLNVLKGFMAVSLFTKVPVEMYKFCITLQTTFSGDLIGSFIGATRGDLGTTAEVVLKNMGGYSGLLGLLTMIALAYCVVKLFFANIKRGGILLCQIAVGSLYMFSLPRGFSDGFNGWCKQIFALCLTAFLQTRLGIQSILAGIIVNTGLYTINIAVMGFASNLNLFACDSVFTWAKDAIGGTWYKLIVAAVIVALVGVLISLFLNTRLGLSIRATGDNPDMVRASSINTGMMITIGLCVANALTGLSGGLLAQYQKSCDINLGTGMVTIALASLIIGETIIGKGSMLKRVIGVILGSCLYRFIVAVALRLNVPAECLKLVSSIIVAVAIAFPYLKKQAVFYRQKRAAKAENEQYIAELLREERKGKGGNA